MAQSKKTLSLHETFGTAQVDVDLLAPSNGDYLFVWNVVVEAEGAYTISFPTSGLVVQGNGGVSGAYGICKAGIDDEVLKITCDANTTVRILFDEI